MERISMDKDIGRVITILDKIAQSVGFKNHEDWENKRRDHYKSLDPNEINRLLVLINTIATRRVKNV